MKSKHCAAAREKSAKQSQPEEPGRKIAAKMEMQHVGFQAPQQPHQRRCALRIKDAIAIVAPMAREIDRETLVPGFPQQLANGDEVGLHSAVRRWIRPELHHP